MELAEYLFYNGLIFLLQTLMWIFIICKKFEFHEKCFYNWKFDLERQPKLTKIKKIKVKQLHIS